MNDIYGRKAEEPDEQTIIDRDLASPQFVSWSARKEVHALHDIINTLPDLSHLKVLADAAVVAIDRIDDAIDARMSWSGD